MEDNDALLLELTATRLFVLQRAIAALIVSHPHPELFAKLFRGATAISQVEFLQAAHGKEHCRKAAADFARELLQVADDEVDRRKKGTPDAD